MKVGSILVSHSLFLWFKTPQLAAPRIKAILPWNIHLSFFPMCGICFRNWICGGKAKKNLEHSSLDNVYINTKMFCLSQDLSVSVSVLTLTFIAYDRYNAICRPLQFSTRPPGTKAAVVIGAIWIVSYK